MPLTPPCPGVYYVTHGSKGYSYWDGFAWHSIGHEPLWAWETRSGRTSCTNVEWGGRPRLPFPYGDEAKASAAAPIPAQAPKATPSDRRRRKLLLN